MSTGTKVLTAALAAISVLGVASPASATEASAGTSILRTAIEDDILWFDADVSEVSETIRTKIFAPPAKDGHRRLWQVCKFGSTGGGEYRCGIDVAAGSYARAREGMWSAKLFVGSDLIARTRFSL